MPLFYDLTGKRFGKLVAVKKVGRKGSNNVWECICDCGKTTRTTANALKTRNTRSCGCLSIEIAKSRKEYVNGKTFGNITVLWEAEKLGNKRRIYGRCICGTEKVFMLDHLKDGSSRSCGCKRVF